jgi:hypothetical protein
MCEIPHHEFDGGARRLLTLEQVRAGKGDTTMFPLSHKSIKMVAAGALLALAASATSANANEIFQKSGPVGPEEPILVTVGQKHIIAFFVPGNGQCNVQAVIWNADDLEAKSAAGLRINLNPAQTALIDSSATQTLTLKCSDDADSLSAIESDQQFVSR